MRPITAALLVASFALVATASAAVHENKLVGRIVGPDANRDCLFFQLIGVAQADPAYPGNAWMAIPRAQTGFRELVSMLMLARSSGALVTIYTTGQGAPGCNYSGEIVGVSQIYLEP